MINLDDKKDILASQGGDKVLKSIEALPFQINQAWNETQKINLSEDHRKVNKIIVAGMGGSRFPAIILKELFKDELTIPYLINDDYILPNFVDENTLVIISSYSGTTEETIENGKKALQKGAKLLAITTGFDLYSWFNKINQPCYLFKEIYNPSKQPRIGVGYMVGGHLGFLSSLGFLKTKKDEISKAIANSSFLFDNYKTAVPKISNPAKQLAEKLYQKYPYYIVAEFLIGVGNAIANQTNETAKNISTFRVIPELNHHLMEGLKFPDKLREILVFVFFYSHLYSSRIQKRFFITKEVVEKNQVPTIWYQLKGKNKIEQVFELIGLGSWLTMYLAALYQQDPSVIPYVNYFKKRLKEMTS